MPTIKHKKFTSLERITNHTSQTVSVGKQALVWEENQN